MPRANEKTRTLRAHGRDISVANPCGASGSSTSATSVPAMTEIMNEAEASDAEHADQPTCRRVLCDCSRIRKKLAAKPPRNALTDATCRAISPKNWELFGFTA